MPVQIVKKRLSTLKGEFILKVKILVLSIATAVQPALAAAGDSPKPMTWDECVSVAIKNNPDVAAALRARESGEASYKGSFNGLLPQVSLTNGYSDSHASSPAFGRTSGASWQAGASASMNVFDMSQVASIRSARAALDQAQAAEMQAAVDLRFNLRTAFAQLLFVRQDIDVSQTILDMRNKSARLVALRYQSGMESKGNMLRSKAQALQAEAALSQALRDLKTSRIALDRWLGLDDLPAVDAVGNLDSGPSPDEPSDLKKLADLRPDVAAQEAAVQSARASLARARSALWPALSVNYTRSVTDDKEFPSAQKGWSWSGLLSLPIFGGGPTAAYYSVSAAQRDLLKARENLRVARDAALSDIQSSWDSFAGAVDQVKVTSALVESARQRNDEADISYNAGLLTYDNWEIIATDRIAAERSAVQARLTAVSAEAAWNRAIAKPLGE